MHKVLIVLVYFERPNIVRNALSTIGKLTSDNWHLAFIDDGSVKYPGEPIVREMLPSLLDKVTFYNSEDSIEMKEKQGGSRHGYFMNKAIIESDADIAIVLCDDDALLPDYMTNLDKFFSANPNEVWCYSHVIEYDPTTSKTLNNTSWLNRTTQPIAPSCALDSSQVAFRTHLFRTGGVYFPYPQTGSLDAFVFDYTATKYGLCKFSGCVGEYKGIFDDQLSKRPQGFIVKDSL